MVTKAVQAETAAEITLHCQEGTSDKIYQVILTPAAGGWLVNTAWGRRGATLRSGTKTKAGPVPYAQARKIYDSTVKAQLADHYKPVEPVGRVTAVTETEDTGVRPQLLNPIDEEDVAALGLCASDQWWAQRKFDGKRMMIRKTGGVVTAINRKGQTCGAPEAVLSAARATPFDFLIDGEAIGDSLFAFDLPAVKGRDIRHLPYATRLRALEAMGFAGAIRVAATARTAAEKRALLADLKAIGAEGIVFKFHPAPYSPGRPASGGNQLKCKFYATASVIVTGLNDKSSVSIAVMDGGQPVPVGNVTIHTNTAMPAVGDIIEVRYLYAYRGGCLFQPVFLLARDDLGVENCGIGQLKYKREEE
jgi:bifunctional non-homologous end joining protein LigD